MKITLLIASIVFLWYAPGFAQPHRIDSLEQILKAQTDTDRFHTLILLAKEYRKNDVVKGIAVCRQALELSQDIHYSYGEILAHLRLSNFYVQTGEYRKAEHHVSIALSLGENSNDQLLLAAAHHAMGKLLRSIGDLPRALDHYFKALSIREERNQVSVDILSNIGNLYLDLDQPTEALYYFSKAFQAKEWDIGGVAGFEFHEKKAMIFTLSKDYSSALSQLDSALTIAGQLNNQSVIARLKDRKAAALERLGLLPEALTEANEALEIRERSGKKQRVLSPLSHAASLYFQLKRYPEAIQLCERSLEISQQLKEYRFRVQSYECLYKIYEALKDYPKALSYHQLYATYKDSLINESRASELVKLEIAFNTKKKEQENLSLSLENRLHKAAINRQFFLLLLLVLSILILLCVAYILYIKRQRSQTHYHERLTNELQEKNALINNTDDLIWSIDTQMHLRSFNTPYAKLIEAVKQKPTAVGDPVLVPEFGEEIMNRWKGHYRRALEGEKYSIIEGNEIQGKMMYAEISFYPIFHNSKVVGVSCYSEDMTEKIQVQKALEQSEKKYRVQMERIMDAFVSFDNDWNYTYVNEKAAELLGKKREELIGKNVWELFPEGVEQPFYQSLHQAKETQQFVHAELYYEPWDKWYEDFIYPSPDGISVFYHDITSRVRTQQKLKENEKLLSLIYNSTSDAMGLAEVRPNGEFVYISANKVAIENMRKDGVSEEQYLNVELKEYFSKSLGLPEQLAIVYEREYKMVVQTKKTLTLNRVYYSRRNHIYYLEENLNPILDENGNCTHIIWVSRNVTEKTKALKDLQQSEEKYRTLFQNTPVPLWIYHMDTCNLLEVNEAAQKKYGYSRAEFLNMNVMDFSPNYFSKEEIESFIVKSLQEIKRGKHFENITKHATKDGEILTVKATSHYINYKNKHAVFVSAIDISDQLETEQRIVNEIIKAVEIERAQISSELHDNLTQKLSIASMNLKNLAYDVENIKPQPKYAKALQYLDMAIDQSRTVAHHLMPRSILDFGLISSIEELIEDISLIYPFEIAFKCLGDPVDLDREISLNVFRIIQEALNNIHKHARAGKVDITLAFQEAEIHLEVIDDGIGYDPGDFLDTTNGIGLRIMRNRAIQINGSFSIGSKKGEGTRLRLTVPVTIKTLEYDG